MEMPKIINDVTVIEHCMLNGIKERIVENSEHVPIINNCSLKDFNQRCIIEEKPLILRGEMQNWHAQNWTLDFFVKSYGELELYSNLYDPNKISLLKLKDILQNIKKRFC